MKAYQRGKTVRLKACHPLDDEVLRSILLPRSPGLMPDNSLAVDLTRQEAFEIAYRGPDHEAALALRQFLHPEFVKGHNMITTEQLPDREKLSVAFLDILEEWLTPGERKRVAIANAAEKNPSICHTHDVCDPNQAMIDAWEKLGGKLDIQNDAHIARMDQAWKDTKGLILRRWL